METQIERLRRVLLKLHNTNHGPLSQEPADLAVFQSLMDAVQRSVAAGVWSVTWPAAPPVPEVPHTVPQ